eukprot:756799-Hanusia_phi.AAC.2
MVAETAIMGVQYGSTSIAVAGEDDWDDCETHGDSCWGCNGGSGSEGGRRGREEEERAEGAR